MSRRFRFGGWFTKRRAYLFAPLLVALVALALVAWISTPGIVRELPIAVVDHDNTYVSRTAVRAIDAMPTLTVEANYGSEQEIRSALVRGEIVGAVVIPEGMQQRLRRGVDAEILLVRDGSVLIPSRMLFKELSSLTSMLEAGLRDRLSRSKGKSGIVADFESAPLRVETYLLGNPKMDYRVYLLSGVLITLLQFSLLFALAALHPTRKESFALFAVHLAAGIALQATVIPRWGMEPVALPVLAAAWTLLLATGYLIGRSIADLLPENRSQAGMLSAFWGTTSFALSGWTFPLEAMPPALAKVADLVPLTQALKMMRWGQFGRWCLSGVAILAVWILLLALFRLLVVPKIAALKQARAETRGGRPSRIPPSLAHLANGAVLLVLFVGPVVYPSIYGSMYSERLIRDIKVAVSDRDGSAQSRSLVRTMSELPGWNVRLEHSPEAARDLVEREEAVGWIEIPGGLEENLANRRPTQLRAFFDTRRFYITGEATKFLTSAVQKWSADRLPSSLPRVSLVDQTVGDRYDTYGGCLTMPLIMLILHQLMLVGVAVCSAGRSLSESLRRTWVFPVWFTLLHAAVWPLYSHYAPNPSLFAPAWIYLYMAATWLIGVLILRRVPRPEFGVFLVAASSFPFIFANGFSWPIQAMSPAVRAVGALFPPRHGILAALRAARFETAPGDLDPHLCALLVLLGTAMVATGIGLLLERRGAKDAGNGTI